MHPVAAHLVLHVPQRLSEGARQEFLSRYFHHFWGALKVWPLGLRLAFTRKMCLYIPGVAGVSGTVSSGHWGRDGVSEPCWHSTAPREGLNLALLGDALLVPP